MSIRKKIIQVILVVTLSVTSMLGQSSKQSLAVIDFDTREYNTISQAQCIRHIINELIRLGEYEVMDKYDIEYIAKRDSISMNGCFSKICLSDFGKRLKVQKVVTGSIAQFGDFITVSIRLLDVNSGTFEKSQVTEYLNIPGNEFQMIRITLNDLFGNPNDKNLVNKLTKKTELDNVINNPYQLLLRSDGPRMGLTLLTGTSAEVLMGDKKEGGYGAGYPFMFQFGYQFEKQYLNEGNFQALFECIPMATGLDQGRLIPSITLLNGIRNNVNGWEFAFGPTFSTTKLRTMYSKDNGKSWGLVNDTIGMVEEVRPDSRGYTKISTGVLFAAGKTFKSGKLNLPVNIYFVPSKYGARFGISMGWNSKDRYQMSH